MSHKLVYFVFLAFFYSQVHSLILGEDCIPNQDLCDSTLNLVCDTSTSKCVCKERYWPDNGLCTAALKSDCSKMYEVCNLIPYALCDSPSNECMCTNGYTEADIYCLAPNLGDHCLENEQCPINSACVGQKCECNTGYVANKDTCEKVVDYLGDACKVNEQCTQMEPMSECVGLITQSCECQQNYYVNDVLDETCLPIARKIGDVCVMNEQCSQNFGPEARCNNGVCSCRAGSVASIDLVNCLTMVPLSGSCIQDQQCSSEVDGSECHQLKCRCKTTHEEAPIGRCSKRPEFLGDSCVSNTQCELISSQAECRDETCQCKDTFVPHPDLKQCLQGVFEIGTPCTNNVQCSANIENSICSVHTEVCDCINDFVPAEDKKKCLPRIDWNEPCQDNGQCTVTYGDLAECVDQGCRCKDRCHFYDNKCWNTRVLDDPCSDTRECRLAKYHDRVECSRLTNTCTCKAGLTPDIQHNLCNSGVLLTVNIALLSTLLAYIGILW